MRNCPEHQVWDFDCTTCVDIASQRVTQIKKRERRELVTLMTAPPSSR